MLALEAEKPGSLGDELHEIAQDILAGKRPYWGPPREVDGFKA